MSGHLTREADPQKAHQQREMELNIDMNSGSTSLYLAWLSCRWTMLTLHLEFLGHASNRRHFANSFE